MMEVCIQLQGLNLVNREFQFKFGMQDTLDHLKRVIESTWNINQRYQELFSEDGRKLSGFGDGSLQSLGLEHRSKVIVKHSMTPNWEAFLANVELAQQASSSKRMSQTQEAVDHALSHLMPLMTAKFLVTFPQYDHIYRQFKANFARYVDQEFKYIEVAVKDFLSKVLSDNPECPVLDFRCDKKGPEEDGVQGGLVCQVLRDETLIGKYYIKEHMGLSNCQDADLRELFVYKVFEKIGVGPKAYFIPNIHYSSLGLYIGTDEVPGFQRADTAGLEISHEVYAQRDLLRRVLFVKDLHSKNYGLDGDGKLSIVDFQIKSYVDPKMVQKYFDGYRSWKGSQEIRVRVAKEYIKLWNLRENFDNANAAISVQKELFKKHSISYKPSRNFEEYFFQINKNLDALTERLK